MRAIDGHFAGFSQGEVDYDINPERAVPYSFTSYQNRKGVSQGQGHWVQVGRGGAA